MKKYLILLITIATATTAISGDRTIAERLAEENRLLAQSEELTNRHLAAERAKQSGIDNFVARGRANLDEQIQHRDDMKRILRLRTDAIRRGIINFAPVIDVITQSAEHKALGEELGRRLDILNAAFNNVQDLIDALP